MKFTKPAECEIKVNHTNKVINHEDRPKKNFIPGLMILGFRRIHLDPRNKKIRTEIKTTNISFKRLIISFKRYNKSLNRYKIEWKLKQENQNGH